MGEFIVELVIAGLTIGFLIGIVFASWSHARTIRYKAETGIDMNIGGTFYKIRFSNRGDSNDEFTGDMHHT